MMHSLTQCLCLCVCVCVCVSLSLSLSVHLCACAVSFKFLAQKFCHFLNFLLKVIFHQFGAIVNCLNCPCLVLMKVIKLLCTDNSKLYGTQLFIK